MSGYPGYAQANYAVVPPPNQFYAPPQQYNGYPVASYQSYRRGSDPDSQERRPPSSRRGKSSRQSEDEVPRISRPIRPRKSSMRTGIAPDFIFISLSSQDILKITNINSRSLLEDIRESLIPFWPQKLVSENVPSGEWRARLGYEAWTAGGTHGILARRFICRLFAVLAEEGFGYLATVDNHPLKAPRLVFTSVPSEIQPRYFMISFSLNRRTVTVIDAPEKLTLLLGAALRTIEPQIKANSAATTPRIRPADGWIQPGVYEIVTSERGNGRQDITVLMAGALKLIASEGWRFEASVPFGKNGVFGLKGRREVWMFRKDSMGMPPRLPRSEPRR